MIQHDAGPKSWSPLRCSKTGWGCPAFYRLRKVTGNIQPVQHTTSEDPAEPETTHNPNTFDEPEKFPLEGSIRRQEKIECPRLGPPTDYLTTRQTPQLGRCLFRFSERQVFYLIEATPSNCPGHLAALFGIAQSASRIGLLQ